MPCSSVRRRRTVAVAAKALQERLDSFFAEFGVIEAVLVPQKRRELPGSGGQEYRADIQVDGEGIAEPCDELHGLEGAAADVEEAVGGADLLVADRGGVAVHEDGLDQRPRRHAVRARLDGLRR